MQHRRVKREQQQRLKPRRVVSKRPLPSPPMKPETPTLVFVEAFHIFLVTHSR